MLKPKIKGITIQLAVNTKTGVDALNVDMYSTSWIDVENVLVYPSSETEVLETVNLYGKKAIYTLCIPKGDTNNWENTEVTFFGETWRTIGKPKEYIEKMLPLDWNKQVRVETISNA